MYKIDDKVETPLGNGMNIYDEALKELQKVIGEYGMDYYNDKHFPITIKALERAKKEHELLELYKSNSVIVRGDITIKNLEKELEELK